MSVRSITLPGLLVLVGFAVSACSIGSPFQSQPHRVTIGGPNYGADTAPAAAPAAVPQPAVAAPAREPSGIVYFATNSAELTPEGTGVLTDFVGHLRGKPAQHLTIEGHADARGSREFNIALGMRRAASVKRYLVMHGVAAEQLRIVTLGREKPLVACSASDCLQRNRRVHLFLNQTVAGRG